MSVADLRAGCNAPPALPDFFERYQPIISEALKSEVAPRLLGLYDTHRYYMGWNDESGAETAAIEGKRLRPTLTLLGAEVMGGDIVTALPIAIALEYVHNFSLIHDDLEDRDRFRHHRATVWVVWGEATAIISGNAMLKVADRATSELVNRGVGIADARRIQSLITEAYLKMIEGQYLDLAYESRPSLTVKEYLGMIDRKTGALIEASLHLGGLVASGGDDKGLSVQKLRRFGYEMGRLFQIRDDMLGVWGGEETGKPVGADLRRKKKALPAIHALAATSGTAKKRIDQLFEADEIDENGISELLEMMEAVQTRSYCEDMLRAHFDRAARIIEDADVPKWGKQELLSLGSFLLNRVT